MDMLNNDFDLSAKAKKLAVPWSTIIREVTRFSDLHCFVSLLLMLFVTWLENSGGAQAHQPQQPPTDTASDKSTVGQPSVSSSAAAADDDARYRIGPGDILDL